MNRNFTLTRLFTMGFTLVLFICGKAQDTLVKTKGDTLVVKLVEVNPDNIRYKKISYVDGPVFMLMKEDVKWIFYGNGQRESFETYVPVKKQTFPLVDNSIQIGGKYFYYHDKRMTEPDMLAVIAKLNDKRLNAMSKNIDRLRFWQNATLFGGIGCVVSGIYVYQTNRSTGAGGRGRGRPRQTANNIQAQSNAKLVMLGGLVSGIVSFSFMLDRRKHDRIIVDAYNQQIGTP